MKPDFLRELLRIDGPRGSAQQLEDPYAARVAECPVDSGFIDDRLGLHDAVRSYDVNPTMVVKTLAVGSNEN
jgi:hypothetical protein